MDPQSISSSSANNNNMRLISPLMARTGGGNNNGKSLSCYKTAMVILNTPIAKPPSLVFQELWKLSQFRICADGGANRLMESTRNIISTDGMEEDLTLNTYIPDAIRGDLDSLRQDTRDYYASHGVDIEKDPDQDTNDLDKALEKVMRIQNREIEQVVIYGGFGGRFDQEMASFQALYKWSPKFEHRIWLYSDETMAVLIPGDHQEAYIDIQHDTTSSKPLNIREGPTCGLIPLGCPCDSITTTGLKWNLNKTPSGFGGLVSTSNHIEENSISVKSSHPVIFTAEVVVVSPTPSS